MANNPACLAGRCYRRVTGLPHSLLHDELRHGTSHRGGNRRPRHVRHRHRLVRTAFLKQSKEVSDQAEMLKLQRQQLAEQQEERRRAQALRVFVGAPQGLTNELTIFARNANPYLSDWCDTRDD
jgi:hypothetical protein